MRIRFMTYNIQHGLDYLEFQKERAKAPEGAYSRTRIRLDKIAQAIRAQGADVIGLNEVRGRGTSQEYTAQVETLAAMLGYHCYFARALDLEGGPGGAPYGNALLSRFPLKEAQTVLIPDPAVKDEDTYYETRCVLRARIEDAAAGSFTVLASHFGLAKAEERNAVATICDLLEGISEPVVLMGDFNMEPDNPILAPLFARMEDSAACFPAPRLSFPSDHPQIKIDYVFTRGMKQLSADIPAVVVSDHRPHVVDVEMGAR